MNSPGGDIGVHGILSVARALMRAGLVDRIKLVVGPATLGTGTTLWDELPTQRFVSHPRGDAGGVR